MRPQTFGHAFSKLIFIAAVLAVFPLIVFGQEKGTPQCAATDYECLIAKYEKKIESNPDDAEAYYERGYSYIQLKRYAAAIRDFKRVKELDPKNADAVISLEYIYKMIGRGGLSLEECSELIQLEPDKAEYYYARSYIYFIARDFLRAIADATQAIELDPKYLKAYGVRSDSYCKIGKWKESTDDIKSYDKLTGITSRTVCHINLFDSIKQCADDDDCKMSVYNAGIANPRLINSPPGLGDFYARRGMIYYERGNYDLAHSDFKDADKYSYWITSEPMELYLGNLLLNKGKYDEASKKFNSALKLKPESAESALHIGEIYVIKREYEKAFEYLDKAIFLNPRLSKAYLGRGAVYLELGKVYADENDAVKAADAYRKAVKDFDSVIEIDLAKTPSEVYVKRAKAYERLGEEAKAAADRAKAEEIAEKP